MFEKYHKALEGYDVKAGRIMSPGKFEQEPSYAPLLHAMILYGAQDETFYEGDEVRDTFFVDDTLRGMVPFRTFPATVYAIVCYTTEQGFFTTVAYDSSEAYDKDKEEAESVPSSEED